MYTLYIRTVYFIYMCVNVYHTFYTVRTCIYAGKSTLLTAISERDIPIPDHIDIFHLTEEIPASDKTPMQCVMEVDDERCVLHVLVYMYNCIVQEYINVYRIEGNFYIVQTFAVFVDDPTNAK